MSHYRRTYTAPECNQGPTSWYRKFWARLPPVVRYVLRGAGFFIALALVAGVPLALLVLGSTYFGVKLVCSVLGVMAALVICGGLGRKLEQDAELRGTRT